jgi:hypothetical protein
MPPSTLPHKMEFTPGKGPFQELPRSKWSGRQRAQVFPTRATKRISLTTPGHIDLEQFPLARLSSRLCQIDGAPLWFSDAGPTDYSFPRSNQSDTFAPQALSAAGAHTAEVGSLPFLAETCLIEERQSTVWHGIARSSKGGKCSIGSATKYSSTRETRLRISVLSH